MIQNRIRPGQLVFWRNQSAIVHELKGLSEVVIRTIEGKITEVARVSDLSVSPPTTQASKSSHVVANNEQWDLAVQRYEIIRPILEQPRKTLSDVDAAAQAAGKSVPTIYRWIKRFEETGLVSSLLRPTRADKGGSRMDVEQDAIIIREIESYYLKLERPNARKLYDKIVGECHSVGVPTPHINTIYQRIKNLNDYQVTRSRFSPKQAKEKFGPITGKFPNAEFPNAVVQIDHTPVDVIIVDELHRLPIGRPYITIAIDVATRMITGFRITLEHPSASSAGLCIAHAIGRKEHWLAKKDIHAEWPIYGKMEKIHLDNAKEFRGKMLERACAEYGIIIEHRPKGQPNYGPHVERAFRTFMEETHSLPGTTFSNVKEKQNYNSEGRACFTLSELETWFTVFLVYCYHHKAHKGISKMAPIQLYNQMIHGTDTQPGVGLPTPVEDEETLRLHFTPYLERTIQRYGVEIDQVKYYSPILRKWIGAKTAGEKHKARKFIFARDPRDISQIYFLDPDTSIFVPIPYLNNTRPAISVWELKASIKELRNQPHSEINEEMIFQGIQKMRALEQEAIEKTRLAKQQRSTEKRKRRMSERREHWKDVHAPAPNNLSVTDTSHQDDDDIEPYSDIQLES
jgi:putative transposase